MNSHFLISLATVLCFEPIHSLPNDTATVSLHTKHLAGNSASTKIKWTSQLPLSVKNAWNKSPYASWYIEKIIKHDSEGNFFYRFIVNNGNLLDADHHDSFLHAASFDISETGIILCKEFLY